MKNEIVQYPPKIVQGSKEWPSHFQMIEKLEIDGMLLIRRDADMGIYCGTWGVKVDQPIDNHIKIETLDKKQHIFHLSNLEVCVPDSIEHEWIEIEPGKYRLHRTIGILR
ncbi:MAG: hypothetical protein WC770_03940 [Phycisphaerae bacterium]